MIRLLQQPWQQDLVLNEFFDGHGKSVFGRILRRVGGQAAGTVQLYWVYVKDGQFQRWPGSGRIWPDCAMSMAGYCPKIPSFRHKWLRILVLCLITTQEVLAG